MLTQDPWNFKGSLRILKEWDPSLTFDEVDLTRATYWIQIHGLPLEVFGNENALLIGNKIGKGIEADNVELHRPYLRLKVRFDTSNPLEPGFYYHRNDDDLVWVAYIILLILNGMP